MGHTFLVQGYGQASPPGTAGAACSRPAAAISTGANTATPSPRGRHGTRSAICRACASRIKEPRKAGHGRRVGQSCTLPWVLIRQSATLPYFPANRRSKGPALPGTCAIQRRQPVGRGRPRPAAARKRRIFGTRPVRRPGPPMSPVKQEFLFLCKALVFRCFEPETCLRRMRGIGPLFAPGRGRDTTVQGFCGPGPRPAPHKSSNSPRGAGDLPPQGVRVSWPVAAFRSLAKGFSLLSVRGLLLCPGYLMVYPIPIAAKSKRFHLPCELLCRCNRTAPRVQGPGRTRSS